MIGKTTFTRRLPIVVIGCVLFTNTGLVRAANAPTIAPEMLPMAIIGYAFDLAYGQSSTQAASKPTPLAESQHALYLALQDLNADVLTKMAFVREAFVIQPEMAGARFVSRRGSGSLFITTAIPSLSNSVVVVVSSSSPQNTTIFTIDSQLRPKLIYDSLTENRFAEDKAACFPLGQVIGIRVSADYVLSIQETSEHWANRHSRTFTLDLRSANIRLRCTKSRAESVP